jgi:hypothetical protein
VHDLSKAERRAIRELAGLAYERELAGELTKLRASFDAWVAGERTPFELEQVIHQFHDGVSRQLFNRLFIRVLALSRSRSAAACGRVKWRAMGRLLEKVIEETAKLPEPEQEAFAAFMLAELESERRWDELFARSQDVLARMAEEARQEYRAGRTEPLDLDKL